MLGLQQSREGLSPSGDGDVGEHLSLLRAASLPMAISEMLLSSSGRITGREASVERPVAPPKGLGSLCGWRFPRLRRWPVRFDGGRSWTGRQPARPPAALPRTCAPPAAPGSAAFVSPAPGSPQPQRPPRAPRQLGTRRRSGLAARRLRRRRRRPSTRRAPGKAPPAAGRPRPARPVASASVPRGTPSSAKEPLPNADIIQNKNFIYFFCSVSQSVSSKECRTLKTNLAFFAFTDCLLQFRRMLQT